MGNNIQKSLGKRIQELRKIAKYSQEQFAERIGVAINTLSNIERGNSFMTAQTLENIITTLKVRPQELFEFPENPKFEEDSYIYIINRINSIKENKHKMEILKKFLKFVL